MASISQMRLIHKYHKLEIILKKQKAMRMNLINSLSLGRDTQKM